MFRWLRWKLAQRRLASVIAKIPPSHIRFSRKRHRACSEDFPPNTNGYDVLASVWNDFAAWFVPDYGPFLKAAEVYYGQPIRTVLDVACGTGLLSRRIAVWAKSVVGLDASEAMLRQARQRLGPTQVRYVQGDFRKFALGETFDAAVCASDSLNYVQTAGELTDVFACVGRHLRPGGLFVFDVLDHQGFRNLARRKTVATVDGRHFELYLFYDAGMRVSESCAVFGDIVERHRRIPIEEQDVRRSASQAGLQLAERFATLGFLSYQRRFYVLRKP
jgi:SAM-dependent methyltransferase